MTNLALDGTTIILQPIPGGGALLKSHPTSSCITFWTLEGSMEQVYQLQSIFYQQKLINITTCYQYFGALCIMRTFFRTCKVLEGDLW
jgi:hypothetical protein